MGIIGKNVWPELLGKNGDRAIIIIEQENHAVTASLVPEGSFVTADFRCDRVRVWVNKKNIIIRVPAIG